MAAATFLNNLLGKSSSRSSRASSKSSASTATTSTTDSRAFRDVTHKASQSNQVPQSSLGGAKKAPLRDDQPTASGLSRQTVRTSLVRPAVREAPVPVIGSGLQAAPLLDDAPAPMAARAKVAAAPAVRGGASQMASALVARGPQMAAPSFSSQLMDDGDLFEPIQRSELRDIDSGDCDAPQFVSEYVAHIYDYLRKREMEMRVNPRYMSSQIDISESMRRMLVTWMVDVGLEFQLMSETTFLAVTIVDQFLQQRKVPRDRLQLLGIAAMLMASKYEEIYHPPVEDFLYICANAFDRPQLVKMELYVLQTLKFDLGFPTALNFLRRYSKAAGSDAALHTCCKYFLELSLAVYAMVGFPPSKIAASAVYLSRKIFQKTPTWDETMQFHSKYSEADLMPCVKAFNHLIRKEASLETPSTISEKYASKEFMKISTQVLGYYRKRARSSTENQM